MLGSELRHTQAQPDLHTTPAWEVEGPELDSHLTEGPVEFQMQSDPHVGKAGGKGDHTQ